MATIISPKTIDAAHRFLESLAELRLLDHGNAEAVESFLATQEHRKPTVVADFLVEQGALTPFQAAIALQNGPQDLVLSQFILVDKLGQGSMGPVFKARSTKDESAYAVKIVPRRNVANLNEVADKVRLLKDIRHPRVSALISLGAAGERVFLAWPYLEDGEKLDAFVQRQGKLTPRQAVQIASQIASGLKPYHEAGLFHGLLKPSDVLIGSDRRVRLLDFGVGFLLATERGKALLDTMTNNKTLARGLDCASPESLLNPLDRSPAGDRYSLGCILYYCLTGQYPFPMENPLQKMMAHQLEQPRPIRELNQEVSPRLATVVETLLKKRPEDRYEDSEAVVQALQVAVGSVATNYAPSSGSGTAMAPLSSSGTNLLSASTVLATNGAHSGKAVKAASTPVLPTAPRVGQAESAVRPPSRPRGETTKPGVIKDATPPRPPALHSRTQKARSMPASQPSASALLAPSRAPKRNRSSPTTILVVLGTALGVIIGGALYWILGKG